MFYAHFVLSKKGPLARIWLAAHWDKKLTKAHVFETNIDSSVEAIIEPKVKLALRTSGHLLLGVVRIYSRKAKYLLADCNEAFVKIKMAFRPGVVDLPEENREAAVATITLPETFHDFDTTMADLTDLEVNAQFSVNQSRPEEITMREDLGNITLVGDDGFGDMGFGAGDNMLQDAHMDDTLFVKNPETSLGLDNSAKDGMPKPMDIDFDAAAAGPKDGAGDAAFGDEMPDYEGPAGLGDDDDYDDDDNDGGDFGGGMDTDLFGGDFAGEGGGLFEEPPVPDVPLQPLEGEADKLPEVGEKEPVPAGDETNLPETTTNTIRDQTTLIPNEAEAFALEPIDVTSMGTERKAKRKRKLVIDEQKGIASETMKLQLSDTSDIVTTLDLAPPTKKLMHWKETGGVEKLFALPGRNLVSKRAVKIFNKKLITRPYVDGEREEEADKLELEQEQPPEPVVEEPAPAPPAPAPPAPEPVVAPEPVAVPEPVKETAPEHVPLSDLEQSDFSRRSMEVARGPDANLSEIQPPLEEPSLVQEPSRLDDPSLSLMDNDQTLTRPNEDDYESDYMPGGFSERRTSSEDNGEDFRPDDDAVFNEALPDEPNDQAEGDEADEDAEERRWNKRTQQILHVLNRTFQKGEDVVSFKDMVSRNNRKQVASKFYSLLVLKKVQAVKVEQNSPYGDILVQKGPKFEVVY